MFTRRLSFLHCFVLDISTCIMLNKDWGWGMEILYVLADTLTSVRLDLV